MEDRRQVMAGSPVFWLLLKFVFLGPLLHLLFRPKATGLEHIPREGGALVAANHVSFLDPLVLPLVIPRRRVMFLTKVKYIDKRFLRWILRGAGVIPVAADGPGTAAEAVAAGVQAVQQGRLVGIFPEGTRSPDGRLQTGKTGVARIAIQAAVPVIPAGIVGTDRAFPRGARLPRPRSVEIRFGPPIRFDVPVGTIADSVMSRHATRQVMTAIGALSGQQPGTDPAPPPDRGAA
jgi:1-acyl-sn-glycerol-3-phosphate acyltransferase